MSKVKERRRGSKLSSKNQLTIPVEVLREAGLSPGDRVVVMSAGPGRIVLEREHDVLAELAGRFTGLYRPGELDELRNEWD